MVLSRPDAASIRRFGDTLLVEISDAVMIVPAALFHKMPERVRCAGSMETGSPVVAANQNLGRYIRSIARLVNVGGLTVGWIYLVDDYGPHREEVVQANRKMSLKDRGYFNIHLFPGDALSSVAAVQRQIPPGLRVVPCSEK
ncbi:MAG: hypothetical protein PXZ07_00130 [Candidatus Eremiobacteraeota bacterium]|nr:hypothetical protein [Candidatus Eremiobacteraeota bacterium]